MANGEATSVPTFPTPPNQNPPIPGSPPCIGGCGGGGAGSKECCIDEGTCSPTDEESSSSSSAGFSGFPVRYANGTANTIRPTGLTYPNGRVLDFDYGTTNERDDILSRVSALKKSNDTRCAYTYLGLDQWLEANYAEPGVKLTYLKQTGDPDFPPGDPRDPGDQYTGLDRFGRVQDQRWLKTSDGTHRERVQYGYDRANNRIWRQNLVAGTGQDEFYTYDGLYQVSRLKRGTLNTNKTDISGTPTWQEDFAYDATGNWHGTASAYVTRTNGVVDLDQNRSHNQVNAITDITETTGPAWVTPVHDAAGNMTTIPQPNLPTNSYDCTWDAWNRLVQIRSGQTTIAEYAYDGLARRVAKAAGGTTRHYYYSDKWQVLEERTGSNPETAIAERQTIALQLARSQGRVTSADLQRPP